jgi:predicted NUDIX family NTP pyrophosphohydrolase
MKLNIKGRIYYSEMELKNNFETTKEKELWRSSLPKIDHETESRTKVQDSLTEIAGKKMRDRQFNLRKKQSKNSEPITSFGIILVTMKDNTVLYLLHQRRDSVEYVEFMRGTWANEGQLMALVSGMTSEERERILNFTFDELWDDLWVCHDCRIYRECFSRARRRYEMIRDKLPSIMEQTTTCIDEPPWGFPKGKKNKASEDPFECALRELHEETRLCVDDVILLKDEPYAEHFKGTNGKAYATYYYLSFTPYKIIPNQISTPQCIRETTLSEEAHDAKWLTYDQARKKLNFRRRQMLSVVKKSVDELVTRNIMKS